MENKLTSGSVLKGLVGFSAPFLLSYFLQTLYGLADLIIIGQYCDVKSTTAVSIGSQVMHMITVMIVGLAMGATVQIGKSVGAKNNKETSKIIGTTILLFGAVSIALTIIVLLMINSIVSVMSTPKEAIEGTREYLLVCFIGIPFITAYNIICSVFRGTGDSKRPMYFVGVACVINIVLDVVFVGPCNMGPKGAALATVIAQSISVIVSLVYIKSKKSETFNIKGSLKFNKVISKEIIKIGLPIALQDGFIQISFLLITIIANKRGLDDAAAVGIVEKIITFLFLVPSSMLSAVSTMAAQNIGAGYKDRAKRTLWYATSIAVSFGILFTIIMQLSAGTFISIFTKDATVLSMGIDYMHGYVFDCIFAGIHFCFSGYFCACNRSGLSFVHNFVTIVLARVPLAYLTSLAFPDTLLPMGLSTAFGSVLSAIMCIGFYFIICKEEKKNI